MPTHQLKARAFVEATVVAAPVMRLCSVAEREINTI
jgi:hypothetical protein